MSELFRLQGYNADTCADWQATTGCTDRAFGIMLGNTLSVNVVERLLCEALWASGLVIEQPRDRWQ